MARRKKYRKLPNGRGSITKLGKTAAGRERVSPYMARLPAYYDINGKAIRPILGCYKTYDEAFDALIKFDGVVPSEQKLIDVYNMWKDGNYYKKLTPKSQDRYDRSFKRFERLYSKRIADIKLYQLQAVIDEMVTEGYVYAGEEKQYTAEYIMRLKIVIKQVYKEAIKHDLVKKNLGNLLEVDGRESVPEKQVFSASERQTMINNADNVPFVKYILIMTYSGMRPGEFRGLKVKSLDFENKVIKNFGIKTKKGKRRVIPIHPLIEDYLKEFAADSKTGYIYEKNGERVSETTFYDDYYDTLEKLNLPIYVPKSCRSTFATMAHESGMDHITLMNILGHEDLKTTNDNYIDNFYDYIYNQVKKVS